MCWIRSCSPPPQRICVSRRGSWDRDGTIWAATGNRRRSREFGRHDCARLRTDCSIFRGWLYIVYNGDAKPTSNSKGSARPMLIIYDPKSRSFSRPERLGPSHSDHHYSPIIWADKGNYLHVLHGCHRTPGTHLISEQPVRTGSMKITWHEGPQIAPSLSYPTVFRISGDRELIHYRTDGHTSSWTYRISEDNGRTWTGPEKDVTDLDRKGRLDWY